MDSTINNNPTKFENNQPSADYYNNFRNSSANNNKRESMAKLDSNIDFNSRFTEDLSNGFEPNYRNNAIPITNNNKISSKKFSADEDPWAITHMESTTKPWNELTGNEKIKRVVFGILKGLAVLTLLYFFVCSLDLLSLGFRLVGGRTTGEIFRQSEILQNPVVGVMIGILTTVLVQSSSTSTSIIVSMVSAGFLDVKVAIPIIMGANIGTSITNTIVSLTQAGDRNQFRRAFAGATVHDMFNWLTVICLVIVEVTTGYLFHLTTWIMDGLSPNSTTGGEVQLLSVITDPFVDLIAQLDKEVLECWSHPTCNTSDDASLLKEFCGTKPKYFYELSQSVYDELGNEILATTIQTPSDDFEDVKCDFLFAQFGLNDLVSGVILLACSLAVLCTCLILIVKVLQSVMRGQIASIIKTTLNAKIPYMPWLTGYLALLVGAVMTFLVQSSSVFTSALTPLVGLGVISVERVYPLTLGSNIGTTTTALLAAMAVEGDKFQASMQIALCHLFFNITGIAIFYPIPFLRFPIGMAKFLGDTTAKYRWFAIAYMILMFVVLPVIVMGLSFAGPIYVIIFAALIFLLFAIVLSINKIRSVKPEWLPDFLQSWKWLPLGLRSLEPYDKVFTSWACCKKLRDKAQDTEEVYENPGYDFTNETPNGMTMIPIHNNMTNNSNSNSKVKGNYNAGFEE